MTPKQPAVDLMLSSRLFVSMRGKNLHNLCQSLQFTALSLTSGRFLAMFSLVTSLFHFAPLAYNFTYHLMKLTHLTPASNTYGFMLELYPSGTPSC